MDNIRRKKEQSKIQSKLFLGESSGKKQGISFCMYVENN